LWIVEPIREQAAATPNVQLTINELKDVCDLKGMHQIICYGHHAKRLWAFCQLDNIEVVC